MHVKSLNTTLLSVGQICDQEEIVVFSAKAAVVLDIKSFSADENDVVAIARRNEATSLHEMTSSGEGKTINELKPSSSQAAASASTVQDINVWHNRLVHASESVLKAVPKQSKDALTMNGDRQVCRPCRLGKAHRKSFKSSFEAADMAGEIVHSDLAGKIPKSIHGRRYLITFIDQYSLFTHVMGLRTKGEGPNAVELYKEASFVAYVKNRLPHSSIVCSLFEKLSGKKPTLKHVRPFCCASFVYNERPTSEVHARATPGIFLGCDDNGVYMVKTLTDGKLLNSANVTFDESDFPGLENSDSSSSGESSSGSGESDDDLVDFAITGQLSDSESEERKQVDEVQGDEAEVSKDEGADDEDSESRYPQRHRAQPERYGGHSAGRGITITITTTDTPRVREAMSATRTEVQLWENAIVDELKSLESMKTWDPVDSSELQDIRSGVIKALPSHVVLKIKRDERGAPSRFEARVVAGGHLQVKGRDFDEVRGALPLF